MRLDGRERIIRSEWPVVNEYLRTVEFEVRAAGGSLKFHVPVVKGILLSA